MTAALVRLLPVGEWDVLAHLARTHPTPANCGTLAELHDDVTMTTLRGMADEHGLISLHQAGAGSDKTPPRWLTAANLTEARLTTAGCRTADQVVHLAGTLLLLSRKHGPTPVDLLISATGLDPDDFATLLAHQLVEAVTRDGDPDPRVAPAFVRITARGRRYTTDH